MAPQFNGYGADPGVEIRNRWSKGLEGIMEAYMASKQNAQQQGRLTQQDALAAEARANAEKDRQGALMLAGTPDPRLIASNPDLMPGPNQIQAIGPTLPGQPAPKSNLIDIINKYVSDRDAKKVRGVEEQTLGMDKTRSEINKNNAQADAAGRDQVYVDPTTGKRITIPGGAKLLPPAAKQEGKILPASNVMAMNEGQAVARMLPDVENAIKKNEKLMGPIEGRGRSLNPYDTNAQTTDAQFRVASQAFGRFMEGGVLRKEDEEKYRKMFPQFSDTADVAKNKLSIVRRNLAKKYESDRETMGKSGYDVSGLSALQVPPSMFDAQDGDGGREEVELKDASGNTRIAYYEGNKFVGWK